MGQIYEPIKDCVIIVRSTCDHIVTEDPVKTLPELREYFTMFKRRGELFGYVVDPKRKPGWNDERTTKCEVSIQYTDQHSSGSNGFDNVRDFVFFLENNPAIAKWLGYVKKWK
jgi:hypothetical protein